MTCSLSPRFRYDAPSVDTSQSAMVFGDIHRYKQAGVYSNSVLSLN